MRGHFPQKATNFRRSMYVCTVVCKKIAAGHEKAHFGFFIEEILLRFGEALNCRWNIYLERDKRCKQEFVQFVQNVIKLSKRNDRNGLD